MKFKVMLNVLL